MILHLRTKKIYFGQKKANIEEISNEISIGLLIFKEIFKMDLNSEDIQSLKKFMYILYQWSLLDSWWDNFVYERIILLPPNDMKSLDSDQDFICKLHFSSNVVPICISIKTERM